MRYAILNLLESLSEENVRCADDGIFYIGPDGKQKSLAQLPPRSLRDWQPRHKATVVAAVRHGLISVGEAFRRYNLSTDRYLCWYRCYAPQSPEDG